MSIEQSHGKARPTLPRSTDLAALPSADAAREPSRQRDAQGRFLAGNVAGIGRGWRSTVAKILGRELKGEATALAREAARVYRAQLAELPHSGAQVSSLVARGALSSVLAARYTARAAELGLDTDDGRRALDISIKLESRAERLAVSALDIATRLAAVDRKRKPQDAHAGVIEAFSEPSTAQEGSDT